MMKAPLFKAFAEDPSLRNKYKAARILGPDSNMVNYAPYKGISIHQDRSRSHGIQFFFGNGVHCGTIWFGSRMQILDFIDVHWDLMELSMAKNNGGAVILIPDLTCRNCSENAPHGLRGQYAIQACAPYVMELIAISWEKGPRRKRCEERGRMYRYAGTHKKGGEKHRRVHCPNLSTVEGRASNPADKTKGNQAMD